MLFVFRVDDDCQVSAFDNEVRDQRLLRAEVGRCPIKWNNGLALATAPQDASALPRHLSHDRLDPRLEELLHRHRPRQAREIAKTRKSAFFGGPFDRLDASPKGIGT